MEKHFDDWNIQKKDIHSRIEHKFYHERDIWWCSLGVNIGYEQDGSGSEHGRPVLILKGFSKAVCLVVPLTASKKKNPYHFKLGEISGKESFAIISQIRLVDTKRLTNKIGVLEMNIFEQIKKAVKDLL